MATSDAQRIQLIQKAMGRRASAGDVADVAIGLWQPLASRLASIIGEGGFNSLYNRSLHLTQAEFPWIASGAAAHADPHWLTNLKASLEAQSTAEARKASHTLLSTFTGILASLIGEPLLTSILTSAWGDGAADEATAVGKESSHD